VLADKVPSAEAEAGVSAPSQIEPFLLESIALE
jgi:hypothetical protein